MTAIRSKFFSSIKYVCKITASSLFTKKLFSLKKPEA